MLKNFINFLLFQLGWLACVLSAANMQPWFGLAIASVIVLLHLLSACHPKVDMVLILAAMLVGAVWDSLLVWNEWLTYSSGMLGKHTAPYWIVVIWGLFATTLNSSMNWLAHRLVLAAIFGAVAGPLAYYGGHKLGAVQFADFNAALLALSIGWAVFTPALLIFTTYLNQYFNQTQRTAV